MKKILIIPALAFFALQCTKSETKPEVSNDELVVKTEEISKDSLNSFATQTKKLLMKNVSQQIEKGGVESALEYCNIEAMPLTKSMSEKFGLEISRVSDKMRNPKNFANAEELKLIEQYKQQILEGNELKSVRTETHYYEPLVTNAMCLQCHGEPGKNIVPNVSAKIASLYPEDLATGYKENEVRGLIRIKTK